MVQRDVEIFSDSIKLKGILNVPQNAQGIILFVHGSGSGRFSPRNAFVAKVLQRAGFATLLFDLLTPEEEQDRKNVFDIGLLARRLRDATDWVIKGQDTKELSVGYFGASTGSAAALRAAAEFPDVIRAVVSRGGRPDLASEYLSGVKAPTLLIVGGNDDAVIPLNRTAYDQLRTGKQLIIVPGATHLFEEPGALEEVARLAIDWFARHLW